MNKWTLSEIKFLTENYPEKGKKWCMEKMGKTEGQIRFKTSSLCLRQNKTSEFFKEWQLRAKNSKVGKKRPVHSAIMKAKAKRGELWQQKNPIFKHNLSRTKCYYIWNSMMNRCYNSFSRGYKYYGAKGVTVCKDWHDVITFKNWFDQNYKEGLTIDRINPSGNYCPENCRFLNCQEQAQNKRNLIFSPEKVLMVRELYKKIKNQRKIASITGIDYRHINQVILKKIWNNI
jgi:hypothetical protein